MQSMGSGWGSERSPPSLSTDLPKPLFLKSKKQEDGTVYCCETLLHCTQRLAPPEHFCQDQRCKEPRLHPTGILFLLFPLDLRGLALTIYSPALLPLPCVVETEGGEMISGEGFDI